ncbi:hypothetical protein [Bacillus velezensis]|uniref:hypothetical protein n=1 Tax=Bacillus velezensis TaxID=492670 RepID=UPI0011A4CC98
MDVKKVDVEDGGRFRDNDFVWGKRGGMMWKKMGEKVLGKRCGVGKMVWGGGEGVGFGVEIVCEGEDFRGLLEGFFYVRFGDVLQVESERDITIDRDVRI